MRDPDLLERAIQRVAERRIENAMERGDIDPKRLRGGGKPIPNDDQPMAMKDWVRGWLDRENASEDAARAVTGRAQGTARSEYRRRSE